ncbi:hypothetical protein [Aquiflexum sp.]|uniref:PIN-like domain-containing protein n=1 Tax=Aquiflexum sp. TaxID=1872584 RepID=UPI003593F59C
MIIFTDENIPPHLAKGFDILQKPESLKSGNSIEVKHWPEYSAYSEKDEDWIPKVSALNACMLTQDINISRRKHELELFKKSKLGIFFLRGKNKKSGLSIWEMVEILAKTWPEITRIALTEKKPFGYEIKANGKFKKVSI